MKELAEEQLMLITAESLVDHGIKFLPINLFEAVRNRLDPALGGTSELHSSDGHPHGLINEIHVEVRMGLGNPQLGCSAIELGEVHSR